MSQCCRTGFERDLRSIAQTPSRICWPDGEAEREWLGVGPFETTGESGTEIGAMGCGAASAGAGAVDVEAPTFDSDDAMVRTGQQATGQAYQTVTARPAGDSRSAARAGARCSTRPRCVAQGCARS